MGNIKLIIIIHSIMKHQNYSARVCHGNQNLKYYTKKRTVLFAHSNLCYIFSNNVSDAEFVIVAISSI